MNSARGAAFAVISGGEQRRVRLVATLCPQARVAWSVSDVGFDEGGALVLRDWLQIVQHLGRVDGIIIGDSRVNDRRFELVRSLGLPAVLVGVPWDEDPIPHVENSLPGAGVDEAVDHLVELGYRRIAYIGGPNDGVQALHRRDLFLSKIEEAGLEPVAAISTRYSPNSAALHTDQLLELAAPPTAILYGSDPMALGGIRAAHRRGVSVPEELSVVGFDDLQLSEWFSPLTTVHRDVPHRGRAVATLLLRMLGQDLDPFDIGQPYLVVRDSTTSPPRPAATAVASKFD